MASIRQRTTRAGETTWAVLYRHGGKQSSRTFIDAAAAERFRSLVDILGPDKALAEILDGQPDDRRTVDQLATAFLEWKARDVTGRTLSDYQRDYRNWIKPTFGHRAAEAVTEVDVQQWVDAMAVKLSPKSVADRHMLLHSMYAWGRARGRGLVAHNPCTETVLPRRTRKPPKGTTVAEFRAILTAAQRRNPDAADLILFLGSTGWRWSEGAALLVRAVDDDGDSVWVDVARVFRIDARQRQVLTEDAAKSWAGFRRTPVLPDEAVAMLRRRMIGKAPGDLVFTNSRGRPWNQHTFLRDTWPGIVAAAKLDRAPTPHWLRHMAVGVFDAAGFGLADIQRFIGHEHIETTIGTYGGMVGGSIPAAARDRVNQIMAGRGPAGALVSGEVVPGWAALG